MKEKSLLFFGAHPDDVEWRASGTLLLLAKMGYKIKIVDLTKGEKASMGTWQERIKEAEKSATLLGVEREIFDFGDGDIQANEKNKSILEKIIKEHNPDIIFAPFYKDEHPDHQATGELLKQYDPIFYLPHSPVEPTHVVDISDVFEKRMEAVNLFKSQITETRIDDLINRFNQYGSKIGVEYGEGFFYEGEKNLPKIFIKS